jgi:hypothetical protein
VLIANDLYNILQRGDRAVFKVVTGISSAGRRSCAIRTPCSGEVWDSAPGFDERSTARDDSERSARGKSSDPVNADPQSLILTSGERGLNHYSRASIAP